MNERIVYFLSDQTGVTAETLGHSLITQYNSRNFRQVTLPFIDTRDKAEEAVARINESVSDDSLRPIIFSTLVKDEIRAIVSEEAVQPKMLYLPLYYDGGAVTALFDADAAVAQVEVSRA